MVLFSFRVHLQCEVLAWGLQFFHSFQREPAERYIRQDIILNKSNEGLFNHVANVMNIIADSELRVL